jgi:hypothetical protein
MAAEDKRFASRARARSEQRRFSPPQEPKLAAARATFGAYAAKRERRLAFGACAQRGFRNLPPKAVPRSAAKRDHQKKSWKTRLGAQFSAARPLALRAELDQANFSAGLRRGRGESFF